MPRVHLHYTQTAQDSEIGVLFSIPNLGALFWNGPHRMRRLIPPVSANTIRGI
jgi:hypothetical protein